MEQRVPATEDRPRAKHLMTPGQPRKRASKADLERLALVQRRVLTALVVTTILHLSVGLVIAAATLEGADRTAQLGLCATGSFFGVVAVASGFAIYRRSMATPWLLLGLIPGLVGLLFL